MTQKEIDQKVDELMKRFDEVNAFFIAKIAKQVKKIGELIPSTVNLLTVMADMNEDIAQINQKLADTLQVTLPQVQVLYKGALNNLYTDPRFERALTLTPLPEDSKKSLENYAEAVSRQTMGTMINLSNTTIASQVYRQTVDNAILAAGNGLDYKSATRNAIRELGYGGLQMQYPSGYHRRLDTAIRQNIVDGMNQIAQNGSIMMGEQLGFDAYELSAHARSAPDHEPIQGRVFLKEEFEKLQSGLPFQDVDGNQFGAIARAIGEWNCMHIAMSFSTQHSIRRYSDETLKKYAEDNNKGCEINGKHYTIYEASQIMRQIETQVRREKDAANAGRIAGDMDLRRQCQKRINALAAKYEVVANAAGLTMRKDRMSVEGFRMVKV